MSVSVPTTAAMAMDLEALRELVASCEDTFFFFLFFGANALCPIRYGAAMCACVGAHTCDLVQS